jgi:hypothetical protein
MRFDLLGVVVDGLLALVVFVDEEVVKLATTTITLLNYHPSYCGRSGHSMVNPLITVIIGIEEWGAIMFRGMPWYGGLLSLPGGVDEPFCLDPLPFEVSFPHEREVFIKCLHIFEVLSAYKPCIQAVPCSSMECFIAFLTWARDTVLTGETSKVVEYPVRWTLRITDSKPVVVVAEHIPGRIIHPNGDTVIKGWEW